MSHSTSSERWICFEGFEFDPTSHELRREGRRILVQDQPSLVLAKLLERPGEIVSREELAGALWPDGTLVDFRHGLNTAVNKLRTTLQDSADTPRFVETVPRRGYRFIAAIDAAAETTSLSPRARGRNLLYASGILVALAALGLLAGGRQAREPAPPPSRAMLAVLPFLNLGDDPGRDFFSDGFTVELISRLGRLAPSDLGVIGRTTVMRYKGSDKSIGDIGAELGVDYVLEGSVRESDRIRITMQLVQVSDQTQLWSASVDAKPDNILGAQLEVASRVAQGLALEVLPQDREPGVRDQPISPDAYEAYLRGRHFRDLVTEEGFRKSLEQFESVVAMEPDFAPAYAAMGGCYCLLSGHALEVDEPSLLMSDAKENALKALSLDEGLAEAHGVLAMAYLKYDWDWDGAKRAFRRAIEINPSDAMVRVWHSYYLASQGWHDQAVAEAMIARKIDFLSRRVNVNVAWRLYEARRYAEALAEYDDLVELFPSSWVIPWGRGLVLSQLGRHAEATADLERAVERSGSSNAALGGLGQVAARSGDERVSREILAALEARSREAYVPPSLFVGIHAALGETEEAFRWLEAGYQARSRSMVWLKSAHEFDGLRRDPRFAEFLHRMGLPPDESAT